VVNQLSLITIREWDNLRLDWYHLAQLFMGCVNKNLITNSKRRKFNKPAG